MADNVGILLLSVEPFLRIGSGGGARFLLLTEGKAATTAASGSGRPCTETVGAAVEIDGLKPVEG